MTLSSLLSSRVLRLLASLSLLSRKAYASTSPGERRTPRTGSSVEFADFREYQPGDDLRSVDWRAYGRLDKMYVRQFVAEEDLSLHLLIDISRSMRAGSPVTKERLARQIAAALGVVALSEGGSVSALLTGTSAALAPLRTRRGLPTLLRYLDAERDGGASTLSDTLIRYAARVRRPGMAVIVSDFFEDGLIPALRAFAARGFGGTLIHLLAPEELSPQLFGDLRLRDSESGEGRDVSFSLDILTQYETRLQAFCTQLRAEAGRAGFGYLRLSSDTAIEEVVTRLARAGLLR